MNVARLAGASLCALLLAACVKDNSKPNPAEISPVQHQEMKADLPAAARTNTDLGIEYARRGYMDLAQEKLKKAIDQDDSYALAHSTLAFIYAQRGHTEEADREYRRALELDNGNPDTHNNYGVFLCGQGKRAEADRNFKIAIASRDYTTPEAAWTNAGTCARSAGDLQGAESDFRNALAINPAFPNALAEMAKLSFGRRDYLHTRAFLQRFDKLGKPSADMLALGVKTERALGNPDGAHSYEIALARNFPDSPEAAQLGKIIIPDQTNGR
ncbi:MAG: type IV pilus biogenesis/stability protein PilW [Nevskia sp.]|nr:type IV pilus biogenesis/stability protein PilW [Nevskia sp.]